jgi:hypothetical protein
MANNSKRGENAGLFKADEIVFVHEDQVDPETDCVRDDDRCGFCGENHTDNLAINADENNVTCAACGTTFVPASMEE